MYSYKINYLFIIFVLLASVNLDAQYDCNSPTIINELPFSASALMTSTGPSFHASDFCGQNNDIEEKDYIFAYTPIVDEYISIELYTGAMAGIYVFTDCASPPTACVEFEEGVEETILSLVLVGGTTYYLFIGTEEPEEFNVEIYKEEVNGIAINKAEATQALDVNGAIRIGESVTTPFKGTLKWSDSANELMGYDGTKWVATKTKKLQDLEDVIYKEDLHSIYAGQGSGNEQLGTASVLNSYHTVALGDSSLTHNGMGATDPIHGSYNAVLGSQAGFNNTKGFGNSFIGFQSGYNNEEGHSNVAIGNSAFFHNKNQSNNVAIGDSALYSNGQGAVGNSQGASNTAVGAKAGFKNLLGSYNSFFGNIAGSNNSRGSNNDFFGYASGLNNTTGSYNLFMGNSSGLNNSLGLENIFLGYSSGASNTYGNRNIFVGVLAAALNTTGNNNIAIGKHAMYLNTNKSGNIAIGDSALYRHGINLPSSILTYNTAVGFKSGQQNASGEYNAFFGAFSGRDNDNGMYNAMFGFNAGANSAYGDNNAYFGALAGLNANLGESNTLIGFASGIDIIGGQSNVCLGSFSGFNANGNYNVFLGESTRTSTTTSSLENSIALGYNVLVNSNNQVIIGNSSMVTIGGFEPWTNLSDGRFKKNVMEDVPGLNFIKGLRPVSYQIDFERIQAMEFEGEKEIPEHFAKTVKAKSKVRQSGFIAQEVEALINELEVDFNGVKIPQNENDQYGLSYATFVVPLVKAVQEQQKMIDDLRQNELLLKKENKDINERLLLLEEMMRKK